ncbi:hypothetical protein XENTR_v10023069 [Xenopus tropicalis]|uniref:Uncharacterized LOC116407566 n=1 Tax=Xenopus tropicalis TaxID=8364 RepID=A0A803KCA2_XENTR|nr:uncharacterized protein LOC116407566 [Xenopus tropicalis]KAE8577806.1 hypothetical protein XENTR_v10023069 [Xenopus tropicalis]|eukprot:XP_002943320.2 PREDICTED: uncharacterized protein LOC100496506 [Xenopus tropicalis]
MPDRETVLQFYFRLGLSNNEILTILAHGHGVIISYRTLKRLCRKLGLYRRKNYTDIADVIDFIQSEMEGSGQMQGYRWLHLRLIQRGFVVTQKTVRQIIAAIDPEGVCLRTAHRLRRRRYHSQGPNAIWHIDSYDKLKPYGIAINGCIDGFSRYVIWMEAFTTNSNPKVIANYFIDAVTLRGGCPERIRTDHGTENGHIEQMQKFLRRQQTDNYAGERSFMYGRSTANQRIEGWWSILRKQNVQFWINLFQTIQNDGHFSGNFLDKSLIQFCFLNLIQDELDEVVQTWNSHIIRQSSQQTTYAGRPALLYLLPGVYGVEDRLKPVDSDEVSLCREECLPKGQYPCDKTIFDLCCLLMEENAWGAPEDPFYATDLYIKLRNEILPNL